MDIQVNTTCPSREALYIRLYFVPSDQERKNCLLPFKHNITCENLTYGMIDNYSKKFFLCFLTGVHYNIIGYLECGENYASLSPTTPLYGKYSILM